MSASTPERCEDVLPGGMQYERCILSMGHIGNHRTSASEEWPSAECPRECACGHQEWQHVWNSVPLPDGREPFSAAACTDVDGCGCQNFEVGKGQA